jgi:hypothetical protein
MPDELNVPRGANNPRPRAVPTAKVVDPSAAWFNARVAVSPPAFGTRDRETFAVRVLYTTVCITGTSSCRDSACRFVTSTRATSKPRCAASPAAVRRAGWTWSPTTAGSACGKGE